MSTAGAGSPSNPVLDIAEVTKRYGALTALDRVSLSVAPGEFVVLLGPNGAGKTTTFYMVVGLTQPDSGDVFLGSEEITGLVFDELPKFLDHHFASQDNPRLCEQGLSTLFERAKGVPGLLLPM